MDERRCAEPSPQGPSRPLCELARVAATFSQTTAAGPNIRVSTSLARSDGSAGRQRFFTEQLLHVRLPDELAVADHASVVADLLDLPEQVAGDQHCAVSLADILDELVHLGHALRVETVGGLVED